jgi:glycosyltransferase involved in cell wall biosynthesis
MASFGAGQHKDDSDPGFHPSDAYQPDAAITAQSPEKCSADGTRHLLRPRPYPKSLSLVVPMYNEEAVLAPFRAAVESFLLEVQCASEVIIVNDGSADTTLDQLVAWAAADSRIRVVHLSRNFGHQIAATAGLDHATGDAIVLMDADLQDPLCVVHQMIGRYREGYDVVYGQRETRDGETLYKRFTAWAFYRVMRAFVYRDMPVDTGDFRLISRDCLNALNSMRETHRFLRGMVAWIGYPQIAVRYHRESRAAGSTHYPLGAMLSFAWTAATSFSAAPLRMSVVAGVIVGLFGIEEGCRAILAYLIGQYTVPGWKSLMVVTSMIGSTTLISIGIVGEYLARLYEQSKDRPLYMVARTFQYESVATMAEQNREPGPSR